MPKYKIRDSTVSEILHPLKRNRRRGWTVPELVERTGRHQDTVASALRQAEARGLVTRREGERLTSKRGRGYTVWRMTKKALGGAA